MLVQEKSRVIPGGRSGFEAGRAGLIVLIVVAVAAAVGTGMYYNGNLNSWLCDGPCGPAAVAAPEGVAVQHTAPAASVAATVKPISKAKFTKAVAEPLSSGRLGSRPGFVALDMATGKTLMSQNAGAHTPASLDKLLIGFAALEALGPDHRFTTTVRRDGKKLVLVGGGDPYLSDVNSAKAPAGQGDLADLAKQVAALVGGEDASFTVDYDLSAFSGKRVAKGWKSDFVAADIATEVTPLAIERHSKTVRRHRDQPAYATERFVDLLEARGVKITGTPEEVTKKDIGGKTIASVASARLGQIVDAVNAASNNDGAEMLLRHVAIAGGKTATFEGGSAEVERIVKKAGIPTKGLVVTDGSGLSRSNQVSPKTLSELLVTAMKDQRTAGLVTGLAVGGYSGTLKDRFARATDGRGWVRGKSGTLTGIINLAGTVTLSGGRTVAFALMADHANGIDPTAVKHAVDDLAVAMANCGC